MWNISILRGGGHGMAGLPTPCPSHPCCPAYLSLPSSFYPLPFPPLGPFIPLSLFRPSSNPSCHHHTPQLPCVAPCPKSASQGSVTVLCAGHRMSGASRGMRAAGLNAASHSTSRLYSPIGCRRTPRHPRPLLERAYVT